MNSLLTLFFILCSSSLVLSALKVAHDANRKFHVIVVDSLPWLEGREMLRRLVSMGVQCSYVHLSAASFVMRKVHLLNFVFLYLRVFLFCLKVSYIEKLGLTVFFASSGFKSSTGCTCFVGKRLCYVPRRFISSCSFSSCLQCPSFSLL